MKYEYLNYKLVNIKMIINYKNIKDYNYFKKANEENIKI